MKAILSITLVFLCALSVYSEIHDLFSIRITHPRNQEFIYSDRTPKDTEMWELHLIPGRAPIEKLWVSTLPPSINVHDIRNAQLQYNEPAITQEEYDLMKTFPNFDSRGWEQLLKESYSILLELTTFGGEKFKTLTQGHVKERLAIFIDGNLISAPLVLEPIPTGKVVIQGFFSNEEAKELVNKINAAIKKNDQKIFQTLPSTT